MFSFWFQFWPWSEWTTTDIGKLVYTILKLVLLIPLTIFYVLLLRKDIRGYIIKVDNSNEYKAAEISNTANNDEPMYINYDPDTPNQ